jgi:hypothetical protein
MVELQTNPNAPHRVLITVLTEMHELLPTGECRGIVVNKGRKLLQLDGSDMLMTIKKLSDLLQELQQKCQPR